MKKLNRLLLINWYTYVKEVIGFEGINFLTGKTAAGKSTVIDALQLIVLGDTTGSFFNKAANAGADRSLRGYLYGENGDDGSTGFRYLRTQTFTSYVVGEYLDTERNTMFLTGIVCDCYPDLHYDYKWFIADRTSLPEQCFVEDETNVPYTIPQLRSWLKRHVKSYEIIDTNRRYQELLLGRFGTVKRKYLTLFRKAVPFTPITDIEKFITESVCDVKNKPEIEQMQSDIRQYKNLEAEAERAQEKIEALSGIREITREYEADKERRHQQSYIILRARKEEEKEKLDAARARADELRRILTDTARTLEEQERMLQALEEEISALEEEYHTSDLVRKQKSLQERIDALTKEMAGLVVNLQKAKRQLKNYGTSWLEQIRRLDRIDYPVEEEFRSLISALAEESVPVTQFDFQNAARLMEDFHGNLAGFGYELRTRIDQLKQSAGELELRIDNLKKGIKPYPSQVLMLKKRIESGLFEKQRKAVEIPIFAELLEIRDPKWQNAVEGYLDRQKFNLLVPEAYYEQALRIYDEIRKEEQIYDAGIVDLKKLRNSRCRPPVPGSLAEEIQTEDASARLYADYLLGSVMKCGDPSELNRFRISITPNVMLYKNFVARRLNPARYADPFIGRRSMQIQIANLTRQLEREKKELERLQEENRYAQSAQKTQFMSSFEAGEHVRAVEEGRKLPTLEEETNKVRKELEALDLTWLNRLKDAIDKKRIERKQLQSEKEKAIAAHAGAQTTLAGLEEEDLPARERSLRETEEKISQEFSAEWVETTGEPRFRKELQANGRRQLSLLESFTRARTQTDTIMENHRRERAKKRVDYNLAYRMPYDTEREDNEEYDRELDTLSQIRLPEYMEQIRDAKEKAYNQFRDDFIAKLKSNIESVREQLNELNHSLRSSVFGTDRYHFTMSPRAEYRSYYDMITDPLLMDTGGWNIASQSFNDKYQKEIDHLFRALIINETDLTAEKRAEYERSIKKYTDYKTYLVFDLIVTNDQGEEQRLSRTLSRKSGGETQIPFYIALLASFSQICRIRSKGKNNTIRLIILDEAFSKMDGERIKESIVLLRRFGLQAIFSAPPEKIAEIAPLADRNIAVYKDGKHSFTRHFDPAQAEVVSEEIDEMEE